MNVCANIKLVKDRYLRQREKKATIVNTIIRETLLEVCATYEVVIITNPMNPNSLHHLYQSPRQAQHLEGIYRLISLEIFWLAQSHHFQTPIPFSLLLFSKDSLHFVPRLQHVLVGV